MSESAYLTDQVCACGCNNRMLSGIVKKGWKYIRGHKPTVMKKPAANPRGLVKHTSPEQIQEFFAAQIEQLRKNSLTLKDQAQDLLAEAKHKMKMAGEIDSQVQQMETIKAQTQDALARIFKEKP